MTEDESSQGTFWVYIIWSASHGRYYVGQTADLARRVTQHNDPENDLSKYTKRYPGPWTLLHSESYPDRAKAMAREKALKSGQGRQWIKENVLPSI